MTVSINTGIAEVNGTRLYYEVAGEGHPLVLVHGALVNHHLWDDQFLPFAQHFRVIRYDMRGFGNSATLKAGVHYSGSEDLAALLRFLEIEHAYVMGLSAGGGLALDFTLAHPEMVDALISVGGGVMGFEPKSAADDPWQQTEAALKQGKIDEAVELMLRYWTDGPERTPEQVDPAVRERIRAMTAHNYRLPNDPDASWPDPVKPYAAGRLAEIKVPTLVIIGAKDVLEVRETADFLVKGVKGAQKVVIPDAAHHPNMEKPEEFTRIVLDFLKSLPQ